MIFKHSGDIGDLIYSLPIIKHLGGGELYLKQNSSRGFKRKTHSQNGFSIDTINFIKPLLLTQNYIKTVNKLNLDTSVDVDLDLFRTNMKKDANLCCCMLKTFKIPWWVTDASWLKVPVKKIASVVFNRTERYHNNSIVPNLKDLAEKHRTTSVFIGFEYEWRDFCSKVFPIPFYKTSSLLETASILAGAEIFVGNQSSAMAIAIALNHPQIVQEVAIEVPNCKFANKKIKYLERPVKQIIKIL